MFKISRFASVGKKITPALLGMLCVMFLAASPSFAADPIVVPDVDTATIISCAGKAFAAIALFVAIGMGIRMFKKA